MVIQQHGKRHGAESAGRIARVSEDKTHVSQVFDSAAEDYVMYIDEAAFTGGILRVAFAANDVMVKEIAKEHH
jgi:hypothetical protein